MAKKKAAPKKQMKGDVGKKTGSTTRKAIKAAVNKGLTLEQIGNKTNRDGSTIGAILGGRIDNPPKGLAKKIRDIPAPKKKAEGDKPKGTKSTAAFRKHR